MTRRKISQKPVKRKDDLDPTKDEFINKTVTLLDWAYDRRRLLGLLGGAVLLITIAFIVTNKIRQNSIEEASTLMGRGVEAAMAPVVAPPEEKEGDVPAPEPQKENEILTFDTADARATETLKKYQEAVASQGDSPLGLISTLGMGAAHYDLGQYDDAIKAYQKFLSFKNPSLAWLRPAAVEGLCYALESSEKTDNIQDHLDTLIANETGVAAQMARYHAARLAENKGEKDKAVELLSEVVKSYSEKGDFDKYHYWFVHARERLLRLDPKADVPAMPGSGFGGLDNLDPALRQQLMRAQLGGKSS